MSELAPMVGKFKKVTLNGKEYTISYLDIDGLADYELYFKNERNKTISDSLRGAGISDELIAQKIVESSAKPLTPEDIQAGMKTMSGVRYMLWYGLKKHHSNFKLDKMGGLVTLDNFQEAMDIVNEMGGKAVKTKGKNVTRGKK